MYREYINSILYDCIDMTVLTWLYWHDCIDMDNEGAVWPEVSVDNEIYDEYDDNSLVDDNWYSLNFNKPAFVSLLMILDSILRSSEWI